RCAPPMNRPWPRHETETFPPGRLRDLRRRHRRRVLLGGALRLDAAHLGEAQLADHHPAARVLAVALHVLPLLRLAVRRVPHLATTPISSSIHACNHFLYSLPFDHEPSKRTLPVPLQSFIGLHQADWGLIMAASVLFTLPVVVFFLLVQRRLVSGMVAGSVT